MFGGLLDRFDDKEVQRDMKLVPYKIVNKDSKPYIQVKVKDGETKTFSPEEVSAMILTKMKETAEAFLGKKIKDAVVTVPGKSPLNRLHPYVLSWSAADTVIALQLTSTTPSDKQPRMPVSLRDSMLPVSSTSRQLPPSRMASTRRVERRTSSCSILVVELSMLAF